MSDSCKYDCSAHPKEIQAYGDISGIGVTVAFFATAWMIVLLLIGYYLVAYNPELDPFRRPGKKTPCQHPNAIDYVFLHTFREFSGLQSLQDSDWLRSSQLESALNKCVMMFSDIQIFTGLAVMISGYIALSCGLQGYHWQLIVYLVWLASLTHLAALSFLRNHLSNHPSQLIWRVVAMFMMVVLLAVALGLTGHFNWGDGSSKASDFAVCYLGKKMDTRSVAFESMIKTLILIVYGFFIRVAKMSERFEGRLRGYAARLRAKAMRLQRGDGEYSQPWDSQGFSSSTVGVWTELWRSFVIACCSLLSIHLNLLTSFLAEVYWLTLSVLWSTKRYFHTRLLGPKDEDEWTFGQILPILLVVAPLAAILEHFLPFQESMDTRCPLGCQIPMGALGQPQTDEAQNNVVVDIDHRHIRSLAYRGVFLLVTIMYIELGIFFVADQSPGIKEPLIQLGIGFFILNPLLQLLWIHCTLWISRMNWTGLIRKTTRGAVLSALMSISVNEFVLGFTNSKGDTTHLIQSSLTSYTTLTGGFALSVTTLAHNRILRREPWRSVVVAAVLYPITLVTTCVVLGIVVRDSRAPLRFACSFFVCLFLEFSWFILELLMQKMRIATKRTVYLRCALLLCIPTALVVLRLTTSYAPDTPTLTSLITGSAALWGLLGTIVSFVKSRRTVRRDDGAPSTP